MIDEVCGIHADLQAPPFPLGNGEGFAQRQIDVAEVGSVERISPDVAKGIVGRGLIGELIEPLIDGLIGSFGIAYTIGKPEPIESASIASRRHDRCEWSSR